MSVFLEHTHSCTLSRFLPKSSQTVDSGYYGILEMQTVFLYGLVFKALLSAAFVLNFHSLKIFK